MVALAASNSRFAIITGAGRGIGRAIASSLAKQGCDLALVGRSIHDLEDTAHWVKTQKIDCRILVFACDVSVSEQVDHMKSSVQHEWGTPYLIINNAGIVLRSRVEETHEKDWDQVLDINLKGPFLITRAFLPSMRKAKQGRFIHIASISATLGTPLLSAYCASKWGLLGFHHALTEELRTSGLQSFAILPGSVDTEMLKGSGFVPQMSPEDVAILVAFAALEAPEAMHGAVLPIIGP